MAEPKFSVGMFVWRELMTDGVEAARRFYGELFGWQWKGEEMGPAGTYWMASSGGRQVGGLMQKPAGIPMPPAWSSYVLVDDVDAAAARCQGAGGRVLKAPEDIPNVGRFAVLADPWGARDRAAKLGGKVLVPRIEVPKVGVVAVIADPAGASLGLFQATAVRPA